MMWDQWLNVDRYVKFKIGLQLDINTLNEETMRKAIETIVNNER